MSRVSLLDQLYCGNNKSALEFDYDKLWAPPIRSLFTQEDINELYRIATSLKYNGNVDLKYKLIDSVMISRGFKKAHAGTNRVVYNYLEDIRFVAKVAIDKVGIKDTPREFKNQQWFKPFCCKIFEVDPTGVIGFVERVNPITSLEEFLSVSDDIFNMIITKIVGKYVLDDIGSDKFMNFGLRQNSNGISFGPVILDFPYAYKLDDKKLICNKRIDTPAGIQYCGGDIDYDVGFNYLYCTKCGKKYTARDLADETNNEILIIEGSSDIMFRAKIVDSEGNVIKDSGLSSKTYANKDQIKTFKPSDEEYAVVDDTIVEKRNRDNGISPYINNGYTNLMREFYEGMTKMPKASIVGLDEKPKKKSTKKSNTKKKTSSKPKKEEEHIPDEIEECVDQLFDILESNSSSSEDENVVIDNIDKENDLVTNNNEEETVPEEESAPLVDLDQLKIEDDSDDNTNSNEESEEQQVNEDNSDESNNDDGEDMSEY